jgi:hypothetical protein
MSDRLTRQFECAVHAFPVAPVSFRMATLGGEEVRVLGVDASVANEPFGISFEQVQAGLEELPGMFFEPDGSFFWGVGVGEQRWQLNGELYDRAGCLQYVDLRGCCTLAALEQIFACLGGAGQKRMYQLRQHALFLAEDDFREWVFAPTP